MNKSVESMACKSFEETIELANRIKELAKEILILNNRISALEDQLHQKENIIKEVREYIEENANKEPWKSLNEKELLEILDKENK